MPHSKIKILKTIDPNISVLDVNKACDTCHFEKQRKLPFPFSSSIIYSCFDLIHIDIWGPISTKSLYGHQYFLTILDDYSRYTWIFLMENKSEARDLLKSFFFFTKTQFDTHIKILRLDNGLEFHMPEFYKSFGTIHQTTCVYTPH